MHAWRGVFLGFFPPHSVVYIDVPFGFHAFVSLLSIALPVTDTIHTVLLLQRGWKGLLEIVRTHARIVPHRRLFRLLVLLGLVCVFWHEL